MEFVGSSSFSNWNSTTDNMEAESRSNRLPDQTLEPFTRSRDVS